MPQDNITLTPQELEAITKRATKTVADSMGLAPASIPDSVKKAIATATTTAISARANTLIQRNVDAAVKDQLLKGAQPLKQLDARVSAARDGIAHVVADAKVDAVLADTAKLLFKKFSAFRVAGFDDTQAFNLLLAEVQGRAARKG
jgi:hypothetical protein